MVLNILLGPLFSPLTTCLQGWCMNKQFMFLTVLIEGPANPKDKLDLFLQPLIKELNDLWSVGVVFLHI
ncbi:hypothetical protein CASFOL_027360 [Castilleja foliolosa]|uniref:Uncharacterized protein n=1 Tax=Castilleja foliolosa TaxID=1961234 RepID=A0ABD3CG59_9LAMI